MNLGVHNLGVGVEHGAHAGGADRRVRAEAARPVCLAVVDYPEAYLAEAASAGAVGEVAELLHVHVRQSAGVVVFVAEHRRAGRGG